MINFVASIAHSYFDCNFPIVINLALPVYYIARNNQLDVRILKPVKKHYVNSIVGKNVGELIESRIESEYAHKSNLWLWNDLDILSQCCNSRDDAALVLGTGLNGGMWVEGNSRFVNFELGSFGNFDTPSWLQQIDTKEEIENYKLENIVSGNNQIYHLNQLTGYKLAGNLDDYLKGFSFSTTANDIWLTGQQLVLASLEVFGKNKTLIEGGLITCDNYSSFLTSNKIDYYSVEDSNLVGLVNIIKSSLK